MFGLDSLSFHADVGVKVNTPLWRINSASQQLGFSVSETQSHPARCISDTAPPPHLHPTFPPTPPPPLPTLIFIGFAAADTLTASPGTAASKCVYYGGITPAAS